MYIETCGIRGSLSILKIGDTFTFNGLSGSEIDWPDRLLTITGISVSGDLQYTINSLGDEKKYSNSIPYPTALMLIDQRIWQKCDVKE